MTLHVYAEGKIGQATFHGQSYRCAIGRSGIASNKTEGDGISPVGEFDFIRILYRPDRSNAITTKIDTNPIRPSDGWCDDPGHADYNRPVTLPHDASCEILWRGDSLYDLVVVTSHNSAPIIPGAGSAVFVHISEGWDFPPTEGCIAFAREDLVQILSDWVVGKDRLVITKDYQEVCRVKNAADGFRK